MSLNDEQWKGILNIRLYSQSMFYSLHYMKQELQKNQCLTTKLYPYEYNKGVTGNLISIVLTFDNLGLQYKHSTFMWFHCM